MADEEWAGGWLSEREASLYRTMQPGDRSHAVGVAKAVSRAVDERPALRADRDWMMAAALLHDVGKGEADLGVPGRVVATLGAWLGGDDLAHRWSRASGMRHQVGLYMRYPDLGAELLAAAGSDARVVAWAREHHNEESDWTVQVATGRVLKAADDG